MVALALSIKIQLFMGVSWRGFPRHICGSWCNVKACEKFNKGTETSHCKATQQLCYINYFRVVTYL